MALEIIVDGAYLKGKKEEKISFREFIHFKTDDLLILMVLLTMAYGLAL